MSVGEEARAVSLHRARIAACAVCERERTLARAAEGVDPFPGLEDYEGPRATVARAVGHAVRSTEAGRSRGHECSVRHCAPHREHAAAEVERLSRSCWLCRAPESVGGPSAVEAAGCMALQSEHVYIVVRPDRDGPGARWLAWLGIGSHMTPVYPAGARERREDIIRGYRGSQRNGKRRAREAAAAGHATAEAALAAATEAWRAAITSRVAEIRRGRGGTLAWGLPVEPQSEPLVIGVASASGAAQPQAASRAPDAPGGPAPC